MSTRMNGAIKTLKTDKGYGFLTSADGTELFFHFSQVRDTAALYVGAPVSYTLGTGRNGKPAAIGVSVCPRDMTAPRPVATRSYFGKDVHVEREEVSREPDLPVQAAAALVGAGIGALVAGPVGALIMAGVGSALGEKKNVTQRKVPVTRTCLRCGGTGKPTAESRGLIGFQCENCRSFWRERRTVNTGEFIPTVDAATAITLSQRTPVSPGSSERCYQCARTIIAAGDLYSGYRCPLCHKSTLP